MTTMLDMGPQAREVAALLEGVRDDGLDAPTPCTSWTVGGLLDHLLGLTVAFRDAADKNLGETTGVPPADSASSLPDDWRDRLPRQLVDLAAAWRNEAAWEGETQVGGVDLPGAAAGGFAVNELVLHGWDLARATGQPYTGDPAGVHASAALLAQFADAEQRARIFGPAAEVPAGAGPLERAVALSGRDPGWTPAANGGAG